MQMVDWITATTRNKIAIFADGPAPRVSLAPTTVELEPPLFPLSTVRQLGGTLAAG